MTVTSTVKMAGLPAMSNSVRIDMASSSEKTVKLTEVKTASRSSADVGKMTPPKSVKCVH